jgi:multidrug efflux pump subunit AcrB
VEDASGRVAQARLQGLEDTPQLRVSLNDEAITAFQIALRRVNSTLSTAWGGTYVNDFVDRGRVKKVYVQGDAPYRSKPQDLGQWYVRGSNGQMAPFVAFAQTDWTVGAPVLPRFNGIAAQEVVGNPASGVSSVRRCRPWKTWRQAQRRVQRRLGRPVVSGARREQPDRPALWRLDLLHLPVPGRAL